MSINATLLAQMIVFILLVLFTMKYVWPVIRAAMDEREQRIADGLAAAERGQSNLEQAKVEAEKVIDAARIQAKDIMDAAQKRANDIVEEAKGEGERERSRQIAMGRSELEQELGRARDELRGQVAAVAMAGAERILAREIDAGTHRELLEQLAADL
jgi:F-type H+-transporting ATPase subunit b